MASEAQRRAVKSFRKRRRKAGVVRFEVAAPARDKELIRGVARRLTDGGADADALRAKLSTLTRDSFLDEVGGIWRALRESPAVGADLEVERVRDFGRKIDL